MPSERELAQQHGLSRTVVTQTLAELIDEGLLYAIPRLGTFAGPPPGALFEFYLLALRRQPQVGDLLFQLQTGFEERIAQLGGTSLVMLLEKALKHAERGELPPLAGVFEPGPRGGLAAQKSDWNDDQGVAMVQMQSLNNYHPRADLVSFDDEDGGRQATQHLLGLGHRRIAFLGMHSPQNPDWCLWSQARQKGWEESLRRADAWSARQSAGDKLSFHPVIEPLAKQTVPEQAQIAQKAARPLVARRDITAVVAANDAAAMGLLEALRQAEVPPARWPAIVGFDNLPLASGHVLTSLRLPWEELGRTAAYLLWERRHARLPAAQQHRQVAMRLIPRLTCRADWSRSSAHAALATVA